MTLRFSAWGTRIDWPFNGGLERKIRSLVLNVSSLRSLLDISVEVLNVVEHMILEFK